MRVSSYQRKNDDDRANRPRAEAGFNPSHRTENG